MDAIETKRLLLRNFRPEDAEDLYAYLHQPTAPCFFSMALKDRNAAEDEAGQRSESDEYLAVCLKDTGRLIGDVFAMPKRIPILSDGTSIRNSAVRVTPPRRLKPCSPISSPP